MRLLLKLNPDLDQVVQQARPMRSAVAMRTYTSRQVDVIQILRTHPEQKEFSEERDTPRPMTEMI